MDLVRLIYVSKVARQVRFPDVELIAERAAERNRRVEVTGLLVYTPSHFLQVLEGPPVSVSETLERIQRDERHSDLRVLDNVAIEYREFARWSMRASMLPKGYSAPDLAVIGGEGALGLLRSCK